MQLVCFHYFYGIISLFLIYSKRTETPAQRDIYIPNIFIVSLHKTIRTYIVVYCMDCLSSSIESTIKNVYKY